jgi:hypothetical protein
MPSTADALQRILCITFLHSPFATPLHMHNAQKTSDWTNNSRAIRELKSRYFKILMLIFFLLKMLRFFSVHSFSSQSQQYFSAASLLFFSEHGPQIVSMMDLQVEIL